eukprot:gb/GECG01003330.1/.p1 GENE.gb/GECG01003330.1/~~gb/GECG01003330.1/.p1  ORF type:complete len:166 (+),score=15.35 gb/GECG01003330.1/:1-498(+)
MSSSYRPRPYSALEKQDTSQEALVHNLYIFDGKGRCLFYREWYRPHNALKHAGKEEDYKLVYGMILTLKHTCKQLSPKSDDEDGMITYTTNTYRLHHYETPTNLHFVLLTSPAIASLREELRYLYAVIFDNFVVRNPMQNPREEIKSQGFINSVDAIVSNITMRK